MLMSLPYPPAKFLSSSTYTPLPQFYVDESSLSPRRIKSFLSSSTYTQLPQFYVDESSLSPRRIKTLSSSTWTQLLQFYVYEPSLSPSKIKTLSSSTCMAVHDFLSFMLMSLPFPPAKSKPPPATATTTTATTTTKKKKKKWKIEKQHNNNNQKTKERVLMLFSYWEGYHLKIIFWLDTVNKTHQHECNYSWTIIDLWIFKRKNNIWLREQLEEHEHFEPIFFFVEWRCRKCFKMI